MSPKPIMKQCKINKLSIVELFKNLPKYLNSGIDEISEAEEIKRDFIAEMAKFQEDFFDPEILPMRDILREFKIVQSKLWSA